MKPVGHRVVKGLEWAERSNRPENLRIGRPRGAKAAGLRYERLLARELPHAKHGQWWKFLDANGFGFCQTDYLLEKQAFALVLELKYTWVPEGHTQIEQLYRPVVSKALKLPVFGIVVCRNLVADMPKRLSITRSGPEAAQMALAGHDVVLHWTGIMPLGA